MNRIKKRKGQVHKGSKSVFRMEDGITSLKMGRKGKKIHTQKGKDNSVRLEVPDPLSKKQDTWEVRVNPTLRQKSPKMKT